MSQSRPLLSDKEHSGSEDDAASDSSALDSVLVDASLEKDYTSQAGAGSTEEGGGGTATGEQHPLLLSSSKTLNQSVISDVRSGSVSDNAMHMYLQMLVQVLHESTPANTVAVQHPSFWFVSGLLSGGGKKFWRRLTDSHLVDMAVLRKVMIPRLHRDHWQLFVIDRDLRMVKFYSPGSRTVRIDDREVCSTSSTIDAKNLPLANQVLGRSSYVMQPLFLRSTGSQLPIGCLCPCHAANKRNGYPLEYS